MLKKDVEWTISGIKYLVRNVPYLLLDEEEFFDTNVAIKLTTVKDLMYENEIPHDLDFCLIADIKF